MNKRLNVIDMLLNSNYMPRSSWSYPLSFWVLVLPLAEPVWE